MYKFLKQLLLLFIALNIVYLLVGCTFQSESSRDTLFRKIPSSITNIEFPNNVTPDQRHNISKNNNYYSGGGVGLGDINNDGLLDIYLVGNQETNKLYLNRGNFEFEDITKMAGVGGTKPWSTGVSMVDINGDRLLDIYVANAGRYNGSRRKNELFINNGDLTFTERAEEFGIADSGYSIQASFFDYDRDGDLDMYLVNNYNAKPISAYDLANVSRKEQDFGSGDRLYRNEGGEFKDVTQQVGIFSNGISFGYGATVGDVNRDGWMDIYVSNDFFERDYLYMNQGDGTFEEVLTDKLNSTSTTSMSGDIADLNNNGYPEIYVTDMLPGKEERLKTITDFINWEQLQSEVDMGYHYKFTRNTLHYYNANGTFSEIGRYAGVEATDWSWGALLADFNLDGLRDIFVANGIYKDVTNKDHLLSVARGQLREKVIEGGKVDFVKLTRLMPSTSVSNVMFENQGNLRFANKASEWGVHQPSFSNGSAYGDLDRDGDLDLVVNNVNMKAFVYRNKTAERDSARHWIQLELEGEVPNTFGVGAQVELVAGEHYWYAEQMPQRGFQSSMDPVLHVGLGTDVPVIDTLRVRWTDGEVTLKTGVETNQRLIVRERKAVDWKENIFSNKSHDVEQPLLEEVSDNIELDWRHIESDFNDFYRSPLLFHMRSTEGPPICKTDVNEDGLEDFYVGGAAGQPGALFLQQSEGKFKQTTQSALEEDRNSEDTDCLFVDVDGSGTPELYVASGSSEFTPGDPALQDRLYHIDGKGKLIRSTDALPRPNGGHKATGVVKKADLESDGDLDLFVGTRLMVPYGMPVGGRLLINDGSGKFVDATDQLAPDLRPDKLGSAGITDASWSDLNNDGTPDLIVVGEWMPLTVFYNEGGQLYQADPQETGLSNTSGWWQSVHLADLNGDGRQDLVAGNHGLNSRFTVSHQHPIEMWVGDVDQNGTIEQIFGRYRNSQGPYPLALRHNLLGEIPELRFRYQSYAEYAGQTISEIFTQKQLEQTVHYKAEQLASVIGWNTGDGFRIKQLPPKVQWAPIYAILAEDVSGDKRPELLMGGNLSHVQPQAGPYKATYGILLRQDSMGRYEKTIMDDRFAVSGEVRAIQTIDSGNEDIIIIARNDKSLKLLKKVRQNN